MMEFLNLCSTAGARPAAREPSTLRAFVITLAPFAPHIAEEFWERLGETTSVFTQRYPTYDEALDTPA